MLCLAEDNIVLKFRKDLMNTAEIAGKINGKIIVANDGAAINFAYTSDLLSDVMGHAGDESVLITIQNHLNTIAVCSLAGIEAIVVCHGREIPDDMKTAAEREGIGIISTAMSQFEASIALSCLEPSRK